MHWLITCAIVIVLIVLGFILFIFMPKPTVFFDPYIDNIKIFIEDHDAITKEILDANDTNAVIPIYGNGIVYTNNYPKIYELMRCIPNIRYAGIINIKPKFEQSRQYGYNINANNTIRYFYTIKHSAAQKSGIWIDGAKKFFYTKEWVCGDMSREHSLFNKHKKESAILIFMDIDRPNTINNGNSPNTSPDEIISVFKAAG